MTEPWIDPEYATWVPGTVLGIAAGAVAMLAAFLGGMPRARPWLYALTILLLAACLVLAVLGGVAYAVDQPESIASSFLLGGLICALVVGTLLFALPFIFKSASPPRRR
jgi:hypothetical protein